MFITVKQASEKWQISDRRVRALCEQGKIDGAMQVGKSWNIPENARKPKDQRRKLDVNIFEEIEKKKEELSKRRPLTQGELERLNEEFMVEYTYNSNAIEGSTLTLRETDMVLRGLTIDKKPLKDHLDAMGHKDAFAYICDLVKENGKLTEFQIKEIHTLVLANMPEDRGRYRNVPVRILGAKHTPVEPHLIKEKIEKLVEKYNQNQQNENIIKNLAKFHIEFESIHPFIDGNGRTGRLIVNLELMKQGLPPIDIKFTDRNAYYNAFDSYHEKKDISAMENLFAEYILERINQYLKILNN